MRTPYSLVASAVAGAVLLLSSCASNDLDFTSMEKIDAHVHVRTNGPEFLDQAAKDNFRAVVVILDHYDIAMQHEYVEKQKEMHSQQFIYTTAFPIAGWDEPDWQARTIEHLRDAFSKGATAVKIWKNVGMEFQDKDGKFVMIDDPKFDPIIDFIESQGMTLTCHLGEPRDCWLPLEEMLGESNRNYFERNPEYHMYLHPEYPSYEDHIAVFERMLEKHPNVRYVGCHLASIEWNVKELAKRLDRFPNISVDMAERIDDLQVLDRDEVRQFCIDYQDRLLYATDFGIDEEDDAAATVKELHDTWMMDWDYFTTDDEMMIPGIAQPVKGLDLPAEVVKKIYYKNALKWYPALQ